MWRESKKKGERDWNAYKMNEKPAGEWMICWAMLRYAMWCARVILLLHHLRWMILVCSIEYVMYVHAYNNNCKTNYSGADQVIEYKLPM